LLTYRDRGTSGTQLDVISGQAVVGFLWKSVASVTSGGAAHWSWTWHAGPAKGPQQHGTADSKEAAMAQIEEQWGAWLHAAGLEERRQQTPGN
jgi:hypothetical protein